MSSIVQWIHDCNADMWQDSAYLFSATMACIPRMYQGVRALLRVLYVAEMRFGLVKYN